TSCDSVFSASTIWRKRCSSCTASRRASWMCSHEPPHFFCSSSIADIADPLRMNLQDGKSPRPVQVDSRQLSPRIASVGLQSCLKCRTQKLLRLIPMFGNGLVINLHGFDCRWRGDAEGLDFDFGVERN